MIIEPKNVDKWGMILKIDKVEEPPFGNSDAIKFLNIIKVQLIGIDDPNIAVYVWESNNVKTCYFTKLPNLSTIQEEKTLYIYLEGTNTMKLNPVFLDKYGVFYEPME